jgi:hypothetical protein
MNLEPLIEQRMKGAKLNEIAAKNGLSHSYLRKVWSKADLPTPEKQRREQVLKLWGRGTVKEIAEYLELDVATVRGIALRMGLREGTRQIAIWLWCFPTRRKRRAKRKAQRAA